ncbi:hypothetical protein BDQ12DRAFT_682909 [Crucibulum laeve]|uniref:Secreted protein n=1 Tax=Crucibulum laeve TaxID=68775 RepID=A0A5C3M0U1_9AGAR|nr:hypothetical protein BDQ12DRAFT_682909 [Crucibulum laeve]
MTLSHGLSYLFPLRFVLISLSCLSRTYPPFHLCIHSPLHPHLTASLTPVHPLSVHAHPHTKRTLYHPTIPFNYARMFLFSVCFSVF